MVLRIGRREGERLPEQVGGSRAAEVGEVLGLVAQKPGVELRCEPVRLGECRVDQRERPLAVAGVSESGRGTRQKLGATATRQRVRVRNAVPQFQGPVAHLGSGAVRVGEACLLHRLERGDEGATQVVRGQPVVRQLAGGAFGCRFERLRVAAVEARAFARQQVGVDRLAHQRVPERVFVTRGGEDVREHGLPGQPVQFVRRAVEHGLEQRVLDAETAGGDDAQQTLGGFAEPFVAREQQLAERVRHLVLRAEVGDPDELLDEERDALAEGVDAVDRRRLRLVPQELRGHLRDLGSVQPAEFPPRGTAGAVELAERGAEGVTALHLVGAVRGDQQKLTPLQHPDEEPQQLERGGVGPVEVFEDHHDRAVGRDVLEEHGDELVQPLGARPGGLGGAVCELGKEKGQRRPAWSRGGQHLRGAERVDQPTQDLGERRIGRALVAEIEAATGENERGRLHPGGELGDETRLADAGLTTEDHRPRVPVGRGRELAAKCLEIGLATDHRGAGRR